VPTLSAPRVAVTSLRLRRLPSAAQAPKTRPPPPAVSARLPIRGGEHGRAATHGRSRLRVGTRCCRRRGSDHRAAAAAMAAATDCHALHGPVASPAARCGTLRPVRRAPGAPRGGGRAPAPPPLPRWPPTAAHAVEDTPGGGAAGGWMVAAASRATAAAAGPGGWMTWSRPRWLAGAAAAAAACVPDMRRHAVAVASASPRPLVTASGRSTGRPTATSVAGG